MTRLCRAGHNPAMSDPLDEHYGYLSDRVKLERYQSVIDRLVEPEHVVLDLGCGSGLLGLMALKAGARKALFVEETSVIEMARRTIANSGCGDRAEFFEKRSYDLDLPEKADIVLCDHVGYFGFDYDILRLLADARERFLKPGGIFVPAKIDVMLAPIESDYSRNLVQRWRDGSVPDDFSWVADAAANTKLAVDLKADELIGDPALLGTLALGENDHEFFSWQTSLTVARDATLDGLAGWFDCTLHEDVRVTNAPGANDKLDRPQAFLPIENPAAVRAGQQINATIMARPHDYVLAWTIELPESGRRFEMSTFKSLRLDSALRKSLSQEPDR